MTNSIYVDNAIEDYGNNIYTQQTRMRDIIYHNGFLYALRNREPAGDIDPLYCVQIVKINVLDMTQYSITDLPRTIYWSGRLILGTDNKLHYIGQYMTYGHPEIAMLVRINPQTMEIEQTRFLMDLVLGLPSTNIYGAFISHTSDTNTQPEIGIDYANYWDIVVPHPWQVEDVLGYQQWALPIYYIGTDKGIGVNGDPIAMTIMGGTIYIIPPSQINNIATLDITDYTTITFTPFTPSHGNTYTEIVNDGIYLYGVGFDGAVNKFFVDKIDSDLNIVGTYLSPITGNWYYPSIYSVKYYNGFLYILRDNGDPTIPCYLEKINASMMAFDSHIEIDTLFSRGRRNLPVENGGSGEYVTSAKTYYGSIIIRQGKLIVGDRNKITEIDPVSLEIIRTMHPNSFDCYGSMTTNGHDVYACFDEAWFLPFKIVKFNVWDTIENNNNDDVDGEILYIPGEYLENYFFVDSGLTYNGDYITIVKGLDHIEGEVVSILADGIVVPQQVVREGQIVLETPAKRIHVGLPYESILQTMEPEIPDAEGTAKGRMKRINRCVFRLYNTNRFLYGSTPESEMKEATFGEVEQKILFNGDEEKSFPTGWGREGFVTIVQDKPVPITVVAIIPEMGVS